MPVRVIEGVVQHYAWGDREFIPKLLGVAGRGEPWAELWLGTHPNGPATLDDGSPLSELTGELGYLLKVLAAGEPLSLQTHPDGAQARAGFEHGVFGDPHPKPELLVALTEFEALCGVRPSDASERLLRRLGAGEVASVVATDGPGVAMHALYRRELDAAPVIAACRSAAGESVDGPEAAWVRALDDRYPGEASVAVALLLNHVVLQPGEAIHLTAGNLHAYLRGAGIELMKASDNVVRGGLTVKEVDINLLLDTVDPTPLADPVMQVQEGRYPLPEADVVLERLDPGDSHRSTGHELAVSLDGTTLYLSPGTQVYADSTTFVVTSNT